MRKWKLFVLSFAAFAICVASGCGRGNVNANGNGNGNGNKETALEEKIQQLEQQVATLQENAGNGTAENSNGSGNANEINGEVGTQVSPTASNTAGTVHNNGTSDTVETLTKEVENIIKKVDAVTPSKNTEKKRTEFFEYKDQLQLVEQRVDDYEDYIENEYRQGRISYEKYKKKERQLEELEDRLDASEDKLERNFGMDD